MIRRTISTRLKNQLYIAAVLIFIVKQILGISYILKPPEIVDNMMVVLFFALIVAKVVTQRYTAKQLALLVLFSAVICISSITGRYYTLLMGYFCVIGVQDVDLIGLLKISYRTKSGILLLHVAAYAGSVAVFGANSTFRRSGSIRHTFFIGHPNTFSFILTWVLLEYLFVRYDDIKVVRLLLLWAVSLVSYLFTDSNSGVIVFSAVIILVLCEKYAGRLFRWIASPIVRFGHAALSVIFLAFIWVYPSLTGMARVLWERLNTFFNGRTLFGAQAIESYGITLFGRTLHFPDKVFWQGHWMDIGYTVYFDNYYIGQFILFGFFNLILVSAVFFLFGKRMENREKIVIIAYILYGVMEAYVLTISYCFALLIVGKYIYERKLQPADALNMEREGGTPLWKQRLA